MYKRALFLKPDYADAHHSLAIALMEQGNLDGAMTHCERAIALNPDRAEFHTILGFIVKDQGKLDDALEHFEKAIAIAPDFAIAHFNRASRSLPAIPKFMVRANWEISMQPYAAY